MTVTPLGGRLCREELWCIRRRLRGCLEQMGEQYECLSADVKETREDVKEVREDIKDLKRRERG